MKKNHEALKCALDLEQTFGEELTNSVALSLKREENKCADVFPSLEESLQSFIPDYAISGELGDDRAYLAKNRSILVILESHGYVE